TPRQGWQTIRGGSAERWRTRAPRTRPPSSPPERPGDRPDGALPLGEGAPGARSRGPDRPGDASRGTWSSGPRRTRRAPTRPLRSARRCRSRYFVATIRADLIASSLGNARSRYELPKFWTDVWSGVSP